MRIRKSQLLFPFSSDPHHPSPPPSDHRLPPIRLSDGPPVSAHTGAHLQPLKQYAAWEEEDGSGRGGLLEGDGQQHKGLACRKGSISGSQTVAHHVLSPSTPPDDDDQDGRWCEGEKAIPFKKRRGSFERIIKAVQEEEEVTHAQDNNNNEEKKERVTKMKARMNKKCSSQNQNDDENEEKVAVKVEEGGEREKKRKRGSAVMEGSRCSRVNGRGWRCCQQTLVGYSLCEHHLGKGRLRSITSVKPRSLPDHKQEPTRLLLSQVSTSSSSDDVAKQTLQDHREDVQKKKPEIKKRMKLGVVKARSISSLLGQTTTTHLPLLDTTK